MRCTNCGEAEFGPAVIADVPWKSLPGTLLLGLSVSACPRCGEQFFRVPAALELAEMLVRTVASQAGRLAPSEIRYLRKHLGWTAEQFATWFRADRATVSRWETGAYTMSIRAELLLRVLAIASFGPVDQEQLDTLLEHPNESSQVTPARYARWDQDRGWALVEPRVITTIAAG